ncbi:MAG: ribonuclease BN, partial [Proteobacteria bacterium SW_6_67_9]
MRSLDKLQQQARRLIWTDPPADAPRWHRLLVQTARMAYAVGNDLASGALTLRAMSLVFTSLLAFVPLLAVSVSVLKGFGAHNRIEPILAGFLAPLGPHADPITQQIVGFVDNVEVAVLGILGVGLLLYTAVSLVRKVEAACNYTWNVYRRRTLVRQFTDYLSVIVIGPVLIFMALGIMASLRSSAVVQGLMGIEPFGSLLRLVAALMPYLLVIAAFTFFYLILPNTRVRLSAALLGG